MNYIINKNTLFLYFDGETTVINELATEIVEKGNFVKKILEDSCIYYGSSLQGRIKGARGLITSKYKLPIIISEKWGIIFFPIKGIRNNEIIWVNFQNVREYKKNEEFVEVSFIDEIRQKFMVSYTVFNNQMLKCSRMWFVYLSRSEKVGQF